MISFFVHGAPEPQGSMRAYIAGGRAIVTSANKNLGAWRQVIAARAQEYAHLHEGPLRLTLIFYVPRPKSLKKSETLPAKRPDLDKLERACLDALTGVMYKDDSQVTTLIGSKRYGVLNTGVSITIEEDND